MLIIKTQDNSSTLLDESFLILSNKETVQVGSKVKFVYQNAIYSGTVSHKSGKIIQKMINRNLFNI